jgi:hypothetical protein
MLFPNREKRDYMILLNEIIYKIIFDRGVEEGKRKKRRAKRSLMVIDRGKE